MGVTHVGMESTGVYWKPVHVILEGNRGKSAGIGRMRGVFIRRRGLM
jgi:hypothetical protein